jgi:hypothetical protein
MLRSTGLAVIGFGAIGALTLLGSDRWVAAGYGTATSNSVLADLPTVVGDEAFWLNTPRSRAVTPAAAAQGEHIETRTFEVGARLTLSGATRLNLDIVGTAPVPVQSGLLDAQGRPMILVTARERKGTRIIRFLVEADGIAPQNGEKSL